MGATRSYLKYLWPGGRFRWVWRALILMPVFGVTSVELTSQSWFCNSCHIMEPYYSSWKTGAHKDVECVSCHIPPGFDNFVAAKLNGAGQVVDDLLSRTSTKPSASVSDFSCTRSGCHNLERIKATKVEGKYRFDHAKHIDLKHSGIEVHCTTCHSHVKGSNHFEVNTGACVTCHLMKPDAPSIPVTPVSTSYDEAPDSRPTTTTAVLPSSPHLEKRAPDRCQNCHTAPTKEIQYQGLKVNHAEYLAYGAACESCHSGVTEKPQAVSNTQCFSCHEFGIERMGNVEDLHREHATGRHKVECFSCHGVLAHGPAAQAKRLERIDCQSCHHGQHAIQQKTYKTTEPAPHLVATAPSTVPATADGAAVSPMFLVHVACSSCHINERAVSVKPESGATVTAGSAKACDTCHKPGLGERMVPLWQKNTKMMYEGVVKMVPPTTDGLSPDAARLTAEARSRLDLVRLDGSWGVHNPRYTQKLLEEARDRLVEVRKATSASTRPTEALKSP